MSKTKLIGHRGAASLAPENSLQSIKKAIEVGVDAVEFDIRITNDAHVVLCHDDSLQRTFGVNQQISKSSLNELKKLTSSVSQPIATLNEVLAITQPIHLVIEGKDKHWAKPLSETLLNNPNQHHLTVISFNHSELDNFAKLFPAAKLYALAKVNPIKAIVSAKRYGFSGIDVHFLSLNPLVYWLAKRRQLEIIVYTIDRPWLAKILYRLYPNIAITSNTPQRLQFLRQGPA